MTPLFTLNRRWLWSVTTILTLLLALTLFTGANRPLFYLGNALSLYSGEWIWANITLFGDTLIIFALLLPFIGKRPELIWALLVSAIVVTLPVHLSKEFIPSVMNKIEGLSLENSKISVTDSIISWKGWVIIGLIITSIFVMLFLSDSSILSFSVFTQYFDKIPSLHFSMSISSIFLTGLLAFVFYFIIQISLAVKRVNESEKETAFNTAV